MKQARLPDDFSFSQENMWALEWLWDSLGPRLRSFLQEITQEMENTTGVWVSPPYNESVY